MEDMTVFKTAKGSVQPVEPGYHIGFENEQVSYSRPIQPVEVGCKLVCRPNQVSFSDAVQSVELNCRIDLSNKSA
jgi:hypothetical protein